MYFIVDRFLCVTKMILDFSYDQPLHIYYSAVYPPKNM